MDHNPPNTLNVEECIIPVKTGCKRQADDEATPSRPRKRQAAMPTTRITRSSRKLLGDAVQLNPGLPTTYRPRKKPTPSAFTQRDCETVEVPYQTDSSVEPEPLPTTIHGPTASEPAERASAGSSSVDCTMDCTPDVIDEMLRSLIGTDDRASRQPKAMGVDTVTVANPGGPAPVADMGFVLPLTFNYLEDAAPHGAQQAGSLKRRRRLSSHSSLISPLSGPMQICPISPLARAGSPMPATMPETVDSTTGVKLDWSMLDPEWLKEGDGMWKALKKEPTPAVVGATYLVSWFEQAAELLQNERDAQGVDEDLHVAIVEMLNFACPKDTVDENVHAATTRVDSGPVIVNCGANASSLDNIKETVIGEATTGATISELTTPAEYTKATGLSKPVDMPRRSNGAPNAAPPSAKGPEAVCMTGRETPQPRTTTIPCNSTSASHTADVSCAPKPSPKTLQRIANLQREKELRAMLIEMRRARLAASRPCVQNTLVRSADGSMSIVTIQVPPGASWGIEEDQYSVEEYDEDSVSY